ncbi:hypothetical protein Pmani_035899 [Petrolisthes manimaculis]|uniref:Uncharacterized protein n=1 Tax=Petrolisthes manimaculis TaxID=1843537 RepID=A0AAE1TPZ1_9EUCA|nr:hypothetical protein Pmani_035899 [Petrolisthes manimaculis]
MTNTFVMKVLLWSITTGILFILAIMVGITCLLVHYNQNGFKDYYESEGGRRRDRGRGPNGHRTVDDAYMDPRTDVIRSNRPHVPGKRPPTPVDSQRSRTGSYDEHIYDMPTCIEVTASHESIDDSLTSDSQSKSKSPTQ